MGKRGAEMGHTVLFSSYLIEHRIGSQPLMQNLKHRLRWARSTRRSRPAGYWGQIFTYPLPWALLLWLIEPAAWPTVVLTIMLRVWAAWATAVDFAHDPLTRKHWCLLPFTHLLAVLGWLVRFF